LGFLDGKAAEEAGAPPAGRASTLPQRAPSIASDLGLSRVPDARIGRRRLLSAGAAVLGAALVDAFGVEPRWLEVTEHTVRVEALPRSLEGFLIAHLTDMHLDGVDRVESEIVKALRARPPNLVVLTGDIVESSDHFDAVAALSAELRKTGAPVFASLGNWERWGSLNVNALDRVYSRSGTRLLVNEAVRVDGVEVAATDDGFAGSPRWDGLARERRGDAPRILMTHSPGLIDRAPSGMAKFDLVLSGHTHGGQLRAGSLAPFVPPGSGRYVAGAYDTPLGHAYVSRGTGMSIAPVRFCCRPELPLLRFVRA
jgi:predicted MPP superfamily phosphohydrolase